MRRRHSLFVFVCILMAVLFITPSAVARSGRFSGTILTAPIPGTQVIWVNPFNGHIIQSEQRALLGEIAPTKLFGSVTGILYQNVDAFTGEFAGPFVLQNSKGQAFGAVTGRLTPWPPADKPLQVQETMLLTGGTGFYRGLLGIGNATGVAIPTGASETVEGIFILP